MFSLLLLGLSSFLASLVLTPVIRNIFRNLGLVDLPDERKLHQEPIPRVGGIAVVSAYLLAYGVLLVVDLNAGRMIWSEWSSISSVVPAAVAIFAVGIADDLIGLGPWQKLAGQTAAAALAYSAGIQVSSIAGHPIPSWLAIPVTLIWLVACTNAVNLIDGVDGLAAGVGLFATTTTLLAALLQDHVALALATAPLAGALLGFLRYNFNPATVFLGDSGSLFVGFLLGCFGVHWSQKSATMLGMTAPLMALAIPLLDTALAVIRRFIQNKPIFSPDRGHIHHRLLDRGFTPRKVALILYGACALGAVCSLAIMNQSASGLVIVLFCLVTWMGVQHLGYVEFGVAGRMFVEGAFRRQLSGQLAIRGFEERLASAKTGDERWEAIRETATRFGLRAACMRYGGILFEQSESNHVQPCWKIRIPLAGGDYVELDRPVQQHAQSAGEESSAVAPFADIIFRVVGRSWAPHSPHLLPLMTTSPGRRKEQDVS